MASELDAYYFNMKSNTSKIAKNTVALYIKLAFTILVSLYTSRIILNVLGVEDFGIYNLIGGVVSMFAFFQSSLSNVTQRYLSIALGNDDIKRATSVFAQSLSLFFIISLVLLLLGETIGRWFLENKLVIPIEKKATALMVLHCSLGSMCLLINQIPFISALIAREKMFVYACVGVSDVCFKLIIVISLSLFHDVDSLVLYAFLLCLESFIVLVVYIIVTRHIVECRLFLFWDKCLVKDILRFISISLFGCIAWSVSYQGLDILINLFFGPIANASKAISNQVNAAIMGFTSSFIIAVNPQIIKSYASRDTPKMLSLVSQSSKIAFFLMLLLASPVLYETNFILILWLKQVPEYTVWFVRLSLLHSFVEILISPWNTVVNATGQIRNINIYGRLITLSSLPLSYILLKQGFSPITPMIILFMLGVFYYIYILRDVERKTDVNILQYCKVTLYPILKVTVFLNLALIIVTLFEEGFLRFCAICIVTLIVGIVLIFNVGFNNKERIFVLDIVKKKLKY